MTLETLESGPIEVDGGYASQPEMTLARMEEILTENLLTSERMHVHPDFDLTYFVEAEGGKHPVTFDRAVYDENPEIGFMTYGHPVFEKLLDEALEGRN